MSQSRLFLSVVIPAYNSAKDIEACIGSIVKHAGETPYEILVINNNSTDNTKSVVESMGLGQVKILDCTTQGVSHARNMGIDTAQGEFVTFVDADDVVDEKFLSAIAIVKKNPEVDVFQFPVWVEEKNKTLVGKLDGRFNNVVIQSKEKLFEEFLDTKISNSCCNKFIRREFLNEKKIRFQQFLNAEDLEFVTRCLVKCNTWFNGEEAYYHYLIRENSAMTLVKINKVSEAFDACSSAIKFAQENASGVVAEKLKTYASRTAFFTLTRYAYLSKEDKKDCVKLVKENMHLFQNAATGKFKLIKLFFKVLGVSLTLKLVAIMGK